MKFNAIVLGLLTTLAGVSSNPAFAEWQHVCEQKRCQLFQQITTQKDHKLLARLFFQKISLSAIDAKAVGTPKRTVGILLLPLGIYIPRGATVAVDNKLSFKAQLIDCTAKEGCRAVFDLQPATLDAMRIGSKFVVAVAESRTRREINLTFSLEGFAAAYTKFVGHNP